MQRSFKRRSLLNKNYSDFPPLIIFLDKLFEEVEITVIIHKLELQRTIELDASWSPTNLGRFVPLRRIFAAIFSSEIYVCKRSLDASSIANGRYTFTGKSVYETTLSSSAFKGTSSLFTKLLLFLVFRRGCNSQFVCLPGRTYRALWLSFVRVRSPWKHRCANISTVGETNRSAIDPRDNGNRKVDRAAFHRNKRGRLASGERGRCNLIVAALPSENGYPLSGVARVELL